MSVANTDLNPRSTREAVRLFRWRLTLTYALTIFENFLELLYPLMIGIAINGLLEEDFTRLLPLIGVWLFHSLMEMARQLYDTRTFSLIYQQLAATVILTQQEDGTPTSQLAARSELMREFMDFLESNIPYVFTVAFSFLGALVMLMVFDPLVGAYCLLLLMPLFLLNNLHRRQSLRFNQALNDHLEHEVTIIESRRPERIRAHFRLIARQYIRLSDSDVRTWALMEPFMVGLLVLVLYRAVESGMEIGTIFAMSSYALSFTENVDEVPVIVEQYSRLQDITHRIDAEMAT